MKKVFLLFIAACMSVVVSAQKVYFIYLQTEDQSPFYVRMGDKIYSSASSGFLILPNLTDSTYKLNVGFAKSTEPEVTFPVAVNQDDKGFVIKKLDDGLALFDFKDLSLVRSNAGQKDNTVYETRTDNFSNLLSKAASDPSIVKVPVVKKEEPVKAKPEKKEEVVATVEPKVEEAVSKATSAKSIQENNPVAPKTTLEETTAKFPEGEKKDTVAAQQKPAETAAAQQPATAKPEPPAPDATYKRSVVSRRSESSTTEGFGIVYFDKSGKHVDTIRILIPSSKVKLVGDNQTTAADNVSKSEKTEAAPESVAEKQETVVKQNAAPKVETVQSGCTNIASDKDFIKLRKKMAAGDNDDDMIAEAKKEFKNKCYSVEQVRYLSTLFLTSAAKYQFFDAAFQHVSDRNNFASLASEIKDDYYSKRFKALIGE
jgi:hypothetical protein